MVAEDIFTKITEEATWKDFLNLLSSKQTETEEITEDSLADLISKQIDLNLNYVEKIHNQVKQQEDYWNRSIEDTIEYFYENIFPNDDLKIKLQDHTYSLSDIKESNAGNSFNASGELVKPWYNPESDTYRKVRGKDLDKSAAANEGNLQFTRGKDSKFTRLLMPMYIRNVEIEDFNRNFWVIAQILTILESRLFDKDSGFPKMFNDLLNEISQLWENNLYLWSALATLNAKKIYTNLHVEMPYFNNEIYSKNRIMYDNFESSLDWWNEKEKIIPFMKQEFKHLIDEYQESNLVIIPRVRLNNYKENYYSEEFYPGILTYDRNNEEQTDFKFYSFEEVFKNNRVDMKESLSKLKEYIFGINFNEDTYSYFYPFSDNPDVENKRYYSLVKIEPEIGDASFKYEYDETNKKGTFRFNSLSFYLFDIAARITRYSADKEKEKILNFSSDLPVAKITITPKEEEKNLGNLIEGYNFEDDDIVFEYFDTNNNEPEADLEGKQSPRHFNEENVPIKKGFYMKELISYYKRVDDTNE